MVSRAAVLAVTVLTAGVGWAQTPGTAETYVGAVSGTNVYVRSGPSGEAYPCDKLSYPAKVQVVGEEFGWLKIVPPEGCFSLISKDYVRLEGQTGTVTGADVLVRAGSSLYPNRKDAPQTKLNNGDTVSVLGEISGYYKISPPQGAYLWISSQYVKRTGEALTTLPTETVRRPTTRPIISATVQAEFDAFEAAEAALKKELQKPREQRDLDALLEQYRAVKVPPDHPLAPWVQARIKLLQSEKEQAQDVESANALAQDAQAIQVKSAAERAKQLAQTTTRPAKVFAAEGVLTASAVYGGGATGPKRYAVCDPDSRLITAYVQSAGGVDLSGYVGAVVGVIGTPRYDEVSRTHVIQAEEVVVVKPPPPPPPKPAPRVIIPPPAPPSPAPAPAPPVQPKPLPAPAPVPVPPVQPKPVAVPAPVPAPPVQPKPVPPPVPAATEPVAPLPPTGLPVVEPTSKPTTGVRPEEFE